MLQGKFFRRLFHSWRKVPVVMRNWSFSKEIFEKAYEASHLMSQFMQTKSHLARPSIAAESSFSAEEPMPDHLYHVIFLLGTLRPDSFLGFPEL